MSLIQCFSYANCHISYFRTPYFNIYLVRGVLEVRQILLLIFSFSLVGVWVTFRKEPWAWVLQDILGIAFW